MLAETGMPADEYLRQLKEHAREIMNEGPPSGYPRSMTAAWKLSVDAVKRSRPQALEVLRCCAFFGPEPIPRDVFRRGVQAGAPVGRCSRTRSPRRASCANWPGTPSSPWTATRSRFTA